jgi:hypothetical protein
MTDRYGSGENHKKIRACGMNYNIRGAKYKKNITLSRTQGSGILWFAAERSYLESILSATNSFIFRIKPL